jgi:hypothetical protein
LLFVLSVLAIVPLAALLSHATESVAEKTGDAVGGLLNAKALPQIDVSHADSIAMSERPVITAQLIVAVASRRCALITVTAANNAAMTQNISLSGIIITLTVGLSARN